MSANENASAIVDIPDIALSFPSIPEWAVVRENLLNTIDQIFDREFEVVLIDGRASTGKTFALAQFCRRHYGASFSLFLKPASEVAYDSAYCRMDLSNQINWHLDGSTLQDNHYPSSADYRTLLHRLSNTARRKRRQYYFVIDGLADIPQSASGARELLVGQLPFGLPGIKFLVAGNLDAIPELRDRKLRCREQEIAPFSLEETSSLFAGVQRAPEQIVDLHKRFGSTPGKLASLRRISGLRASAAPGIEELADKASDVFELEWDYHPILSEPLQWAIAALAFLPSIADIATLASICDLTAEELNRELLLLPYIVIDATRQTASLATEFRQLAKKQLAQLEGPVLKKCVLVLSRRPIDVYTVQTLPALLERQGDSSALFRFLSRDNIAAIFSATNSLGSVLRNLERAGDLAIASADHNHAVQFALDRAAIKELLGSSFSDAQLSATQKILGPSEAVLLANREIALEDRLHALCEVGKLQQLAGVLDPTIVAEIASLCNQVEPAELGERAVEIASALMYFDSRLALDLLKRSANAQDDANAMDAALTSISVRAYIGASDMSSTASALREMLSINQIDKADRFASLLGLFAAEQSADVVLSESAKLPSTSDKLALLQQWMRNNHRDEKALSVGRQIITVILDDPTYAPNASVLRDATLPLVVVQGSGADVSDMAAMARSQGTVLKTVGPIVDYYRMRFQLSHAEVAIAVSPSLSPFDEDAVELDDQKDLIVRVVCFAWLHSAIVSIDNHKSIPDALGVAAYAEGQLRKGTKKLLEQSAEHTEVMRPIIQALASIDDALLSDLISAVNLPDRRDECFRLAARMGRSNPYWEPSILSARASLRHYESLSGRSAAIDEMRIEYLRWVVHPNNSKTVLGHVTEAELDLASRILDPLDRLRALGGLVSSRSLDHAPSLLESALTHIREAVNDAETPARVRIGCFVAAGACALVRPSLARELFDRADGRYFSSDHGNAVTTVGLEVLRTYSGLARLHVATDADWSRSKTVLDSISSPVVRCRLASKIALLIYPTGKDHAQQVASLYVKSAIQKFVQSNQIRQPLISDLTASVAPALWLIHPAQAMQLLLFLDEQHRNEAYDNILSFILEGRLVDEPFRRAKESNLDLSEETVSDALAILTVVETDRTFCQHATTILRSIRDRTHRGRISKIQTQEIRRRVRDLAHNKLPASLGIAHEGYLVLIDAELLAAEKSVDSSWEPIIERGKRIPNSADAAFVCASLVGTIPSRNNKSRLAAFEASATLIATLPLSEDKVDRANMLLEEGWHISGDRCKKIARDAFESSLSADRDPLRRRRLKLIESVHRFDEDLAASLSSLAEKQDAVTIGKEEIADRLQTIKLSRELTSDRCRPDIAKAELDAIARASYGALARLNGGTVAAVTIAELRQLLLRTGEASFTDASPIHAYVCEATIKRYQKTEEGPEYMRELFDKYSLSFDLLTQVICCLREREVIPESADRVEQRTGTFIVRPGTRSDALSWISSWLSANRPEELLLVDPYFGPADLHAVMLVQQEMPSCSCTIVTTSKGQGGSQRGSHKEIYDNSWRGLSLGDPPDARVIIVSSDGDLTAQLHDRWWLSDAGGIGLGTSFNSLGDKYSELHELGVSAAADLREEMTPYVQLTRRISGGPRLSYEVFTLM